MFYTWYVPRTCSFTFERKGHTPAPAVRQKSAPGPQCPKLDRSLDSAMKKESASTLTIAHETRSNCHIIFDALHSPFRSSIDQSTRHRTSGRGGRQSPLNTTPYLSACRFPTHTEHEFSASPFFFCRLRREEVLPRNSDRALLGSSSSGAPSFLACRGRTSVKY